MLITVLMMLFIVIPAVGLAIDGGALYAIKSRMQSAADGAALSASRALSRGMGPTEQQTKAREAAEKYFTANAGAMWAGLGTPDVNVNFPAAPPKTIIVDIEVIVNAPTYFMKVFGKDTITVRSISQSVRRDVNIMLVLDRSGSMANSGSCDDMRVAAKDFVNAFVDGRDNLGLITFGGTYRVDFPLANNFQSAGTSMPELIDTITCVGATSSGPSLWTAYQQLLALNETGTLNVILFFTDGQPTSLHMANLDIKATSPCTDKTTKSGIVSGSALGGIYTAIAPGPPPAPNPDRIRVPGSANCAYNSNPANIGNDVVALTRVGVENEVDFFGNSLNGYKTGMLRDASGRIRIDHANTNILASTNAFDNAAQRIRTESVANGLNVVIFCIGLGGPGEAEDTLMQRVANVPESPIYNSSHPEGMYIRVEAGEFGALNQAFMTLASDVMRLAK